MPLVRTFTKPRPHRVPLKIRHSRSRAGRRHNPEVQPARVMNLRRIRRIFRRLISPVWTWCVRAVSASSMWPWRRFVSWAWIASSRSWASTVRRWLRCLATSIDDTLPGGYCLRSNCLDWDEATLLSTYIMLTNLEAASAASSLNWACVRFSTTTRTVSAGICSSRCSPITSCTASASRSKPARLI